MNKKNVITLFIDDYLADDYYSITLNLNKINNNIRMIGESFYQNDEIKRSLHICDIISVNIVGKYISIHHIDPDWKSGRMMFIDSDLVEDNDKCTEFIRFLFKSDEVAIDVFEKLEYLQSRPHQLLCDVELSLEF